MNLVKYFFSDQFVIDEKPQPVYIEKEKGSDKKDLSGGAVSENIADFLTQVSLLMVERDKLESTMNEMKTWTRSSDELLNFIKSMLPFLDAFEITLDSARGFPATEEVKNWLKNIESLYFRFLKILENSGLQSLKCLGRVVDLNIHDVVEYRPSFEHPNDTVIKERQRGYIFRGRLLRDAKVVVAYNERSGNKHE